MNKKLEREFLHVFSDAVVVDVDLSKWYQRVSLLVIADHVDRDESGLLGLRLITFTGVRLMEVKFNHHDPRWDLSERGMHWNVGDFELSRIEVGRWRLAIFGSHPVERMPSLTIEFATCEVERISHHSVEARFPGRLSGLGFVRPGYFD